MQADTQAEIWRDPPRSLPTYAVRAPLAAWLRAEAAAAMQRLPDGYRVLDVGCGRRAYEPFFAPGASEYVGVDVANPRSDLEGAVESLPVPDASYDLVLCTQVLEHAEDPARAVGELRRVVAPGGRVLAATHGVQVYHPDPVDLWRWTHAGLDRLFRANADWSALTVSPASGTAACLAMLVSVYVNVLARRFHLTALGGGLIASVNAVAAAVDRRVSALSEPGPGTLFANYHVTAVVQDPPSSER
jgi:SAM-dependent methyltransferase